MLPLLLPAQHVSSMRRTWTAVTSSIATIERGLPKATLHMSKSGAE
jgi:hypothetical protein